MEIQVKHQSFFDRMKNAALLDVDTYEEVEADTSATAEAGGVIALVAVATAIGAANNGTTAMIGGLTSAFVGWGLWALLTYVIGAKLLGGTATWGELLRTLGFAQSPALLLAFGALPVPKLRPVLAVVVGLWTLITGIVAIRQALDFEGTGKALLTAIMGVFVLTIFRLVF